MAGSREELIKSLRQKGFGEEIAQAFAKVKREKFIPENMKGYAYEDTPLPIGYNQTISQPFTIAFMLKLLELKQGQKILEIGAGSGYVLELMSEIIKEGKIYGVELIKELAIKSKKLLSKDSNIIIINKSGFNGLKEFAPYDRILISASAKEVPRHLLEQLKDPGILVSPVKQSIFQLKKEKGKVRKKEFPGFVFVPLV